MSTKKGSGRSKRRSGRKLSVSKETLKDLGGRRASGGGPKAGAAPTVVIASVECTVSWVTCITTKRK
jgi:hypothetical protein